MSVKGLSVLPPPLSKLKVSHAIAMNYLCAHHIPQSGEWLCFFLLVKEEIILPLYCGIFLTLFFLHFKHELR